MPTGKAPAEGVGKAVTPVPSVLIRPTVLFGASTKTSVFPGPFVIPTGLDGVALTVAALNSSMVPTGAAKAVPRPGAQKKRPEATKARTTKRDSAPERGNRRA